MIPKTICRGHQSSGFYIRLLLEEFTGAFHYLVVNKLRDWRKTAEEEAPGPA